MNSPFPFAGNPLSMINPLPHVVNGMGMVGNIAGRFHQYGSDVKNGLGHMIYELGNKLVDGEQALLHGVTSVVTALPTLGLDLKRKGINFASEMLGESPSPQRPYLQHQMTSPTNMGMMANPNNMGVTAYNSRPQQQQQLQQQQQGVPMMNGGQPQQSSMGSGVSFQQQPSGQSFGNQPNPVNAPQPLRFYSASGTGRE